MITLDNYENIVPYKILMRGKEYYAKDAVSDLEEVSPGEWTANVFGTDVYSVEISMDGDEIDSWYCDCPFEGDICKHVVATLLAICDQRKKISRSVFSKMPIEVDKVTQAENYSEEIDNTVDFSQVNVDMKQCLSFIDTHELSQFVCEYASTNRAFKNAFLKRFIAREISTSSKKKDYKAEIQKIFTSPYCRGRSRYYDRYNDSEHDWETVFNKLETLLEKADFFLKMDSLDNTIAIALQTLRSIGENYTDDLLYDDDMCAPDCCEQAGELIQKVIKHPKATQQQKTDILQELCQIAKISIYRDYDIFDVDELMMQINLAILPAEKSLELIDKLLEEKKDSSDLPQWVLRKVDLLLKQKEQGKADETIRQYLYLSEIRKMEVEKLMSDCRYDDAIRLLDEGIEIVAKEGYKGRIEEWLTLKLKIYEMTDRTSERIATCRQLFVLGMDKLDYYHKLKALVPGNQWKRFLDEMMKETEFCSYFFLGDNVEAEIYVEEKDDARLFHLLSSAEYDQLEALMRYAHHLKNTHSEQLIAIYNSLLVNYAEQKIGRKYYEYIVKVLLCMQKLNGGKQAVAKLVQEFRTVYKRRPAMMAELKIFN